MQPEAHMIQCQAFSASSFFNLCLPLTSEIDSVTVGVREPDSASNGSITLGEDADWAALMSVE